MSETMFPGWVCDGCGKHVSGEATLTNYTCQDCGGRFIEATPGRLACDQCGDRGASRVFNSEHNRLCQYCIAAENREKLTEMEGIARDAIATMQGAADDIEHGDGRDDVAEWLRENAIDYLGRVENV